MSPAAALVSALSVPEHGAQTSRVEETKVGGLQDGVGEACAARGLGSLTDGSPPKSKSRGQHSI